MNNTLYVYPTKSLCNKDCDFCITKKELIKDSVKEFLSVSDLDRNIDRIKEIRSRFIGLTYLTLYSTKEGLNLYERNGFENLENDMTLSGEDQEVLCIPMYLPLEEEI